MPDDRSLLLVSPAPVRREPDGQVRLDSKFLSGMQAYRRHWPGRIDCILRETATPITFGRSCRPETLDFGLQVLPAEAALDLGFAAATRGRRARTVHVIENTLDTRLRIALLDRQRSLPRRLRSVLWLLGCERRRRRALRSGDALQINGYPAARAYAALNRQSLVFLDNRMPPESFATAADRAARHRHHAAGGPLRLVHSGRLEPLKGAQDLIPVARRLAAAGADFTLDIFGEGTLGAAIDRDIRRHGLAGRVRLHGPVDFDDALVPFCRSAADLFLSCHRQGDPSCSYLEAMACGLPVAGFANPMLSALVAEAGAGWTVPMGRHAALARRIAALAADRPALLAASDRALAFARAHDFETEFARRTAQLTALAGAPA